ncbi:MAG TPA: Ni/Fe hydrogenase subunit alpha [Nitrosomonas halophila]|nr:Ni/Fe hydrogenase subunit alpha [Nitrosomonas halophila]
MTEDSATPNGAQRPPTPSGTRRIVIDPVTRVEGHGKITLLMDEAGHICEARFHIVEFRGFEKFIQGRPYWEVPFIVQRLCGICPISHQLAAAKAVDQLVGVDELTPTALKLRRLLHFGQILQSHALHFFHLSSPDLLFGFGSHPERRNIVGVLADYPDIGMKGIRLRKFGQQIIQAITGKRIHGAATMAGGMNKPLSPAERDGLLAEIAPIVTWCQEAVTLNQQIHMTHPAHRQFATLHTPFLGLTGRYGELEFYHGGLRASRSSGERIFDHFDYRDYREILQEEVRRWSYMKFPFLSRLGKDHGWYRVGPLARINQCESITTPLAESARQAFKAIEAGKFVHDTLAYHWTRMIEMLHCAESIQALLQDEEITGSDLLAEHGAKQREGIGVIEAPRGTLFHHYQIDTQGLITQANLIVSTTSNNQAMNESVRVVADTYLEGKTITEALLNHLEVAVRAYDPCLSCATHALGKMPLQVELIDHQGNLVDHMTKKNDRMVAQS